VLREKLAQQGGELAVILDEQRANHLLHRITPPRRSRLSA
jgi:hypothetical protein